MGLFSYLILGLIMGAIAKAILPGRTDAGWFGTLVLGVVGAYIGGLLGNWVFDTGLKNFFSIQTWLLALAGSVIVLAVWGLLTGSKKS